ncbi:DUF31 family putative serine protease [[Mycoplasma] collis]|uniref:DUF31 family putative serine protease n=1 Tax=[Mycoplasma] collis TaxID=2127 RepID=UPI00146F9896|nr:lipoprotein 17-related variable surface protein [[Mycoplasma] collis]
MKKNFFIKLKKLLLPIALTSTSVSMISAGCFSHFNNLLPDIPDPGLNNEELITKEEINDAIIGLGIRPEAKELKEINASEGLEKLINNSNLLASSIVYFVDPDIFNKFKKNFNIQLKPVKNSANNNDGTIKIELEFSINNFEDDIFKKEYVLSGFKHKNNKTLAYKKEINEIFEKQILKIKESVKSQEITIDKLNNKFWDYLELNSKLNLQKLENKNEFQDEHFVYKNFKFNHLDNSKKEIWYSYEIQDLTTKEIFKNISFISNFKNIDSSSLKNDPLSDENFEISLKSQYKNIFSSSFHSLNNLEIFDKFNINFKNKNFSKEKLSLKLVSSKSGFYDQNGILLVEASYSNISRIFKFDVFGYNTLSKKIFELTNLNKNEINENINLNDENINFILKDLNFSKDKTFRYRVIGKYLKEYINGEKFKKHFFFEKDLKEQSYLSISNFYYDKTKKINENKEISFIYNNSLGDEYEILLPLNPKEENKKTILNDFSKPIKNLPRSEIFDDLKKRTLVINYVLNNLDGQSRSVISGTAWVFDKDVKNNTYYLATNLHVVSELLNNRDRVSSFSYSLKSDYEHIPVLGSLEEANGTKYNEIFRRFDKKLDTFKYPWARKINNQSEYINSVSNEFWNNLEVLPFADPEGSNEDYTDFALIKIKFPNDYEYKVRHPFTQLIFSEFDDFFDFNNYLFRNNKYSIKKYQNIPDQVKYYDAHKPKFLISDKINLDSNSSENKNVIFPGNLYFGGYLGGNEWLAQESLAFVYNENNLKREQRIKINNKDIQLKSNKTSFLLPNIKAGNGMSGSMVVNSQGEIVGIFWGGFFKEDDAINFKRNLIKGTGALDTLSIKRKNKKTILRQWLDKTQDIQTNLDEYEDKIKY